jgi:hypothetical protein
MVCRTEQLGDVTYDYCPEDLPARGDRIQAIMRGRFIDELSGNPLSARLSVSTQLANVNPRVSATGVAGLVANPARRFSGLASNAIGLDMRVSCRRYISQTFNASLGPFNTALGDPADFPAFFAAIDLGDVGLHRQATRIRGRCVQNNGVSRTPLSNATVELAGIWHPFPAANVDPLAVVEAPNILSLLQGLYAPRQAGVDQLRQRSLLPQLGEEKNLLLPAAAGATRLRISDRVNLVAGQILGIEVDHNDLVEYIEVTAVDGASTDSQPATVSLAYPLKQAHRQGSSLVRVNPQPTGSDNNMLRNAIVDDRTVFLDALADVDNSTVEISGGAAAEYHRVHLYSVVSDGDGYFSLPPISRVAMMQLHASHAGPLADVQMIFSPDYEQFDNTVDLIFG